MKTIILKFSGPLQSWGTASHFESRHTDLYPSKSAVIGLIAAACGFRRNDDNHIQSLNALHYAVRIDQIGNVIDDYQTAHKYKYVPEPKLERTYVTHRYYLEDAVFTVAVGNEDAMWISQIAEALNAPYFQLYMGRRSCPVPKDFIIGMSDLNPIHALLNLPWQAAEWYQRKVSSEPLQIYADADFLPDRTSYFRRDCIQSLSYKGRRYALRQESKRFTEQRFGCEEHDAFKALGE